MKTVVIEDELQSRNLLVNMLSNYIDQVEVIGEAKDVSSGIQLIKSKRPDLVLLDIEMKGGNGFDILHAVKTYKFGLIFVTGYAHYAIKAIKYAALDYLLKPVDLQELRAAINSFYHNKSIISNRITYFLDIIDEQVPSKLMIKGLDENHVIQFEELEYLESDGNYTKFNLVDGRVSISSYPLKHYEDLLPANRFFRIHKSYIVNIQRVLSYAPGRAADLSLVSGIQLPIAARRKSAFIKILKEINLNKNKG